MTLVTRNGKDRTDQYSAIADAIRRFPPKTLSLDGEVAIFDAKGVSHFQALQKGSGRPIYVAFDCLYCDGKDLRRLPLSKRRQALKRSVTESSVVSLPHVLDRNGMKAFAQAKRAGYEGLVAKDLSAPYVERRSRRWLKIKVHREDEFIVIGYTPPQGGRKYFGALLLGAYVRGKLVYVGRVGTGFDRQTLASLYRAVRPLVSGELELPSQPPGKGLTFLRPQLVAQIAYQEITADGKLRQPVFLGLRDDKKARDVTLPLPGLSL